MRLATLAVVVAAAAVSSASASSAMLAYGKSSGGGVPRYRLWNGSSWGAEASANSIGSEPHWLVLRGSPVLNRFAMATLDNDSDVEVQIWDGGLWGTVLQATSNAGDDSMRIFDLAFEQVSGHILLVYAESGTDSVRYRTHNGMGWSVEHSYAMTDGDPFWMTLTPDPGSDQMILTVLSTDSSDHARAAIWNGSSFTNLSSSAGWIPLHGEFETISNQPLLFFGQVTSTPAYRTFSAGWSASADAPAIGAIPIWGKLYADPMSDMVIAVTLDVDRDINVLRWNGSNWVPTVFEPETNAGDITRRGFDLAFEPGGNHALLPYDDSSNTLKYRTWDGFTWSAELPGPTGGGSPLWTVQAVPGVSPGQIFVTYCTDTPDIRTVTWNGSSFGSASVVGLAGTNKEYESFMAATCAGGTPRLTSWTEVKP